MFPSFYPKGKTSSPAERVGSSFGYVYGDTTSIGTKRLEKPVFVSGADREVLETIAHDLVAITNDPVTTGSLNFEEIVSESVRRKVTGSFMDFSYIGLDDAERLTHAVGHEKVLKLSGARSTDVHFMFLHALTGSRRIYVPYFREADSYGFYLWAELMNFRYGLSSPYDPKRRRVTMPRIYGSDDTAIVDLKRDIGTLVRTEFASGKLERPADIIDLLLARTGCKSARHSERGVVVEHAAVPRPLRLNAPIYSPHHDGPKLREFLAKLKRISSEECQSEFERIARNRADRQWRRFGTSHAWWTLTADLTRVVNQTTEYVPEYRSSLGRLWGRAIALDRQFDTALEKLGGACDAIVDRLRSLAGILEYCVEDAQPIGEGCGRSENALGSIRRATQRAGSSVEFMRRAIVASRDNLAGARSPVGESGKLRADLYIFNGAVQRLGRQCAGYPSSVAEVIAFVEEIFRKGRVQSAKSSWFSDVARLELRHDIWAWLRFLDTAGCEDLEDVIKTARLMVPFRGGKSLRRDADHRDQPSDTRGPR